MTMDSFDRALRDWVGDPRPSAADVERMDEIVLAAIRSPRPTTAGFKHSARIVATAVVAVTAILVAVAVQLISPTPAQAALREIARAAVETSPLDVAPGEFAYRRSEERVLGVVPGEALGGSRTEPLAYLLSTDRETWTSADGDTLHSVSLTPPPTFFDPPDESAYYEAGLDQIDQIGETVTDTFTGVRTLLDEQDWPIDPDQLEASLRAALPEETERSEDVELLDLAVDLLRLPDAAPELRSALLQVIGRLDLNLVERRDDGGAVLSVAYDLPTTTEFEVVIGGDGQLVSETTTLTNGDATLGIPAGTVVESVIYGPVVVTDGLTPP